MSMEAALLDAPPTNDQLVDRAKAGDHAAFEELYRRVRPIINARAFRMGVARDKVEDVVQEVSLRIYERLDRYQAGSFTGWVAVVTRNYVIDLYGKEQRRRETIGELACDFGVDFDNSIATEERGYEEINRQDEYSSIFNQLRDEYGVSREGIEEALGQMIDGYPQQQIADHLGILPATLRSRLSRFRDDIKGAGFDDEASFFKTFMAN